MIHIILMWIIREHSHHCTLFQRETNIPTGFCFFTCWVRDWSLLSCSSIWAPFIRPIWIFINIDTGNFFVSTTLQNIRSKQITKSLKTSLWPAQLQLVNNHKSISVLIYKWNGASKTGQNVFWLLVEKWQNTMYLFNSSCAFKKRAWALMNFFIFEVILHWK